MPEAGWLLLLLFLGMCGLIVVAMLWPSFRRATENPTPPPQQPTKAPIAELTAREQRIGPTTQAPTPAHTLPLRQWLDLVNNRPDEIPHLFVEGGSGAGKTTIATTILHDRHDPVAIVGVKPDDGWGAGYIYRSQDRPAYLAALLTEVRHRLDAGDKSGLTIVLDDFTRLAADHRSAVELYKLIADVGRSLRIRLILIARGRLVKGIGASGESDLLEHFVFITVQRGHHATIEYEDEHYPLDTAQVRQLAQPLPARRWWSPPEPTTNDADRLLSSLFENSGTTNQDTSAGIPPRAGDDPVGIPPLTSEEPPVVPPDGLDDEVIKILHAVGWSMNRIAAKMTKGSKQDRLARIRKAIDTIPEEIESQNR